jgi:hypothetical protein
MVASLAVGAGGQQGEEVFQGKDCITDRLCLSNPSLHRELRCFGASASMKVSMIVKSCYLDLGKSEVHRPARCARRNLTGADGKMPIDRQLSDCEEDAIEQPAAAVLQLQPMGAGLGCPEGDPVC